MQYTVTELKRCQLVKVSGRIDHLTAPQLSEVFKSINEAGAYKIVVDLSAVEYISSAGWWALINAQKANKRFNRGELVLVGLQPPIRESMDLVGIGPYFKQFEDDLQAVGQF